MRDRVVWLLGEDRVNFEILVIYGGGESKYQYRRILLPKATFECSTLSIKSCDMSDEGSLRSLIQEHFEEISNKLTSVYINRTSKKLIKRSSLSIFQNQVPQYKGKRRTFGK